jgi:hypothetical protein
MLVFHAEEDEDKLVTLYDEYMSASPGDANLKSAGGTVVRFRRRRPGRPSVS